MTFHRAPPCCLYWLHLLLRRFCKMRSSVQYSCDGLPVTQLTFTVTANVNLMYPSRTAGCLPFSQQTTSPVLPNLDPGGEACSLSL
jgi:hypothetical protein